MNDFKKHLLTPSRFSDKLLKVGNKLLSLSISILQGFQINHSPKNLADFSILFLIQWYVHSDGNLSSQISTTHFEKNQWWLAN